MGGFKPIRITTAEYLGGPETIERQELHWGVLVRETPGPSAYAHQRPLVHLTFLLQQHVRAHRLGEILVSPVDVVFDEKNALVLQPDLIFISRDRLDILRDRVWGAPDLVVEILSPSTWRYDCEQKLGWFREYGVRECWLVEPRTREITVHVFEDGADGVRTFAARDLLQSRVLPQLQFGVDEAFAV